MRVAEGVDVEDVDVCRCEEDVLNELIVSLVSQSARETYAGEHVPWIQED